MISGLVAFLTSLIITIISALGYVGIFALMAAESALIPIPSEITLTFAGYLASIGRFNLYTVILVGSLADLFGSCFTYWLGRWGERAFAENIIRKYGKYILVSVYDLDRSERWYRKYGQVITFFSRVLPVIRTYISLPAGIAKMNFWRFSLFTFLGSFIWSAFLVYLGFMLGKNWNSLHPYYQRFEYVIILGILLLGGYYIVHKVMKLQKKT